MIFLISLSVIFPRMGSEALIFAIYTRNSLVIATGGFFLIGYEIGGALPGFEIGAALADFEIGAALAGS